MFAFFMRHQQEKKKLEQRKREIALMRDAFHAAWYLDKWYQDPDCAFEEMLEDGSISSEFKK